MVLSLYNTLTERIEEIDFAFSQPVKMYCCGPTVYARAHIGNLRTYLFEDFLRRSLEYLGLKVMHVMNITDIGHLSGDGDEGEDKLVQQARARGLGVLEIAREFEELFFIDLKRLNILKAHITPRASENSDCILDNIQELLQRGFAYRSQGNVYFDVNRFDDYYGLSHLGAEKTSFHRVDLDSGKKDCRDFVLWFTHSKYPKQALLWDSPWGKGYMGWHIECSAMARKYLGDSLDIHCGGVDHIRVHHTNERAQVESLLQRPWVRVWVHGEFLVMDKKKMSKSAGVFLSLDDLSQSGFHALDYRYLVLATHYRKQLSFDWDLLKSAQKARENLISYIQSLSDTPKSSGEIDCKKSQEYEQKFLKYLKNDLALPSALALLWSMLKDKFLPDFQKRKLVSRWDRVLGLDLLREEEKIQLSEAWQELLEERNQAKKNKNFQRADEIRQFFGQEGYVLLDKPTGVEVRRRKSL